MNNTAIHILETRLKQLKSLNDQYQNRDGYDTYLETLSDIGLALKVLKGEEPQPSQETVQYNTVMINSVAEAEELISKYGGTNIKWDVIDPDLKWVIRGDSGDYIDVHDGELYMNGRLLVGDDSIEDEDLFQFTDFKLFVPAVGGE